MNFHFASKISSMFQIDKNQPKFSLRIVPVDIYVPGCPPTAEALMYGFLQVHITSSFPIRMLACANEKECHGHVLTFILSASKESEENAECSSLVQNLSFGEHPPCPTLDQLRMPFENREHLQALTCV